MFIVWFALGFVTCLMLIGLLIVWAAGMSTRDGWKQ